MKKFEMKSLQTGEPLKLGVVMLSWIFSC